MKNMSRSVYLLGLISGSLNLLFVVYLVIIYRNSSENNTISSTYLDGLLLQGNGKPVCECNACYTGPDCSHFLPASSYVVDADSYGNKIFFYKAILKF
ncbi:hypothetical protein M9H77_31783 [Catharanthus roseus]|uniref:Uncharacterized protein n=1 Tax=Catharanthus roseus TaxID=4058 RepID=A0ACC0A1F1_CATRO|nr:hypothetical protein M9H77_31783 [Catharanthus roseus]